MLYVKWQEVLWGKGTQARETRPGAGGRAAVDAVARGCLSGEATAEQRWKGTKGRHQMPELGEMLRESTEPHGGILTGGETQEFQWAGPGEPRWKLQQQDKDGDMIMLTDNHMSESQEGSLYMEGAGGSAPGGEPFQGTGYISVLLHTRPSMTMLPADTPSWAFHVRTCLRAEQVPVSPQSRQHLVFSF